MYGSGDYAKHMIEQRFRQGTHDGYESSFIIMLKHDDSYLPEDIKSMSEAEIAACVCEWLLYHHWEIYPEVSMRFHGKRPDIIGTKGPLVTVIECKKSLGLPVLEQAMSWFYPHHNDEKAGLPHLIFIACMKTGSRKDFPLMLMKQYGMGYLEVEKHPATYAGQGDNRECVSGAYYSLRVYSEPRMIAGSRRLGKILRNQLNSDMRIATPGTTGTGQFMTDWKRTVLKIEGFMQDGKERTVSEIVEWLTANGGYHWSGKASALSGVLAVMKRKAYVAVPYGLSGSHFRWKWEEGVTKAVLKISSAK